MEQIFIPSLVVSVVINLLLFATVLVLDRKNRKQCTRIDELKNSLSSKEEALALRNKELYLASTKLESSKLTIQKLEKNNRELLEKVSDDVNINITGSDFDIDQIITTATNKKKNAGSTSSNNKTNKKRKRSSDGSASV